jgi:hypothetical protein
VPLIGGGSEIASFVISVNDDLPTLRLNWCGDSADARKGWGNFKGRHGPAPVFQRGRPTRKLGSNSSLMIIPSHDRWLEDLRQTSKRLAQELQNLKSLHYQVRMLGLNQRSSRATTWHLCRVIVPRRTITGRLVRGQVWRRHDGRHWLYKKFIEGAAA